MRWRRLRGAAVDFIKDHWRLILAILTGPIGLAVLFNQSRLIEYSLYPYAVILQVTPIVAIAAVNDPNRLIRSLIVLLMRSNAPGSAGIVSISRFRAAMRT